MLLFLLTQPASDPVDLAMVLEASACKVSLLTKRPSLSSKHCLISSGTIEDPIAFIVPETLMTVFSLSQSWIGNDFIFIVGSFKKG